MPMNHLGKLLFPRLPAWQAKRQARHIVAAFSVALVFGLIVMAIMLLQNPHR